MTDENLVHAMSVEPQHRKSDAGLGSPPGEPNSLLVRVPLNELSDQHAEFASFHEGYVRHYIALADTKATVVLSMALGLLTYLFSQKTFHDLVLSPAWSSGFVQPLVAVVFLGLAATCALSVIVPRLKPSSEGLVYFCAVANKPSGASYVEEIARKTPQELTAARIQHCFDTSEVCLRKYDALRQSLWFGGIAILAVLPLLSSI